MLRHVLKLVLAGVLWGGLTLPAAALPPEIEADRYLMAAKEELARENFTGARGYFEKILALKVAVPDAFYYHYGTVLVRTGDHAGAYRQFETYLGKAGRGGNYYMEALQGLTAAEKEVQRAREQARAAIETHLRQGDDYKKKWKNKEAIEAYSKVLEVSKDPEVLHKRGQCYVNVREYAKAIEDFTAALALDPENADYFHSRGSAWNSSGDDAKAIEDYNEAISRNPGKAKTYKSRGFSRVDLKEYDKALADFSKAIELDPSDWNAYEGRRWAWESKGDLDKAIADQTEAIAHSGNEDWQKNRLYKKRADLWKETGDLDKAIADYTQAISFNAKDKESLNRRGNAWFSRKEYDKAIADYTRIVEIDPAYSMAYYNRGLSWWNKDDLEKAASDFTQCLKHKPDYAKAHYNRGRIRSDQRKWKLAVADFTKEIRLDSEYYWSYVYRGIALQQLKDLDGAIADFDKAIGLQPKWTKAYQERGLARLEKGHVEPALADFEVVIDASSYSPTTILYTVTRRLTSQNAYDEAIGLLNRIVEKWPEVRSFHKRAELRLAAGDGQGALDDYGKAIAAQPENPYGYRARAQALRTLGEHYRALADYDRALELTGDSDSPHALLRGKAETLFDMERKDEAQGVYRRALAAYEQEYSRQKQKDGAESAGFLIGERKAMREVFEDYPGMVADLTGLIKDDPDSRPWRYGQRAEILWSKLGDYDGALEDFARVLELKPDNGRALAALGVILYHQGKYRKARKALLEAYAAQSDSAQVNLALAHFFATCPKERYRDPLRAVHLAREAVKSSKSRATYETLAYAFAVNGQFAEAIKAQQEAISLVEKQSSPNYNAHQRKLGKMKERLVSYQSNHVWKGLGHPLDWE